MTGMVRLEPGQRRQALRQGSRSWTASRSRSRAARSWSICGPSGAGKTVLLRLIAGTDAPDRGDIRIDGKSVLGLGAEQRDVGMAFQNFALYPHLTAFENIASPLQARGLAHDRDRRSGSRRSPSLLRIGHVLGHTPRELSNGQKQRTSLARALVRGPGVLLLDDPLRNVDAKLRYEMRLELPRLLRELRLGRDLRHPGLSRGDGAGPPHRRAAPGPLRAGRPAGRGLCRARQRRDRPPVRRSDDQPVPLPPRERRGAAVRRAAAARCGDGFAGRPRGRHGDPGGGHRGRDWSRCPARSRPSSTP